MKYRLTITTVEENKNYEEEKKRASYGNYGNVPQQYIEVKLLEVALNDDEFTAIKKAVLEVIK